jgi:hypothetical protein
MGLIGTGIFAKKEDFEKLQYLVSRGWKPGDVVIVFSVGEGIKKDQATLDARKVCHQLALDYGLPEIRGYYGMGENREFVRL